MAESGGSVRDIFIRLGLSTDGASFAEALAWEKALEVAAHLVVDAVNKIGHVFVDAIEHTAEYGEAVALLAQKTATGVESIQRLSYAAGLSGAETEDLRTGLVRLANVVEEAKDGSESAQKAFAGLGISMSDVRTKAPDQLILLMSDRMKKLGASTATTRAAQELLGRSGHALIPMLLEGSEALRELGAEADASGYVMSAEASKAARDFGDNVKRLQFDLDGLQRELAGPLIQALDPIVVAIHQWFLANRQIIGQKVKEFANGVIAVMKGLASVLQTVGKATMWLADNWKLLAMIIGSVLVAKFVILNAALAQTLVNFALNTAAAILYGTVSVAAGLKAAAAWLAAAAPVVLVAAALTLAALAAEDFYVFLTGGDSVIGALGPKWTKFVQDLTTPAPGDNWLVKWLKESFAALFDLQQGWDRFVKNITTIADFFRNMSGDDAMHTVRGLGHSVADAVLGDAGADAIASTAAQGRGASTFQANVVIQQKEGEDSGQLADGLTDRLERFWDSKMRETAPVGGR